MFNKLTKLAPIIYKDLPNTLKGKAQGFFMTIDPKYKNDKGLVAHERCHIRQFIRFAIPAVLLALGLIYFEMYNFVPFAILLVSTHSVLYKFSKSYRYNSEMEAYGYSIAVGNRTRHSIYLTIIRDYDLDKKYVLKNFDEDIEKYYNKALSDCEELIYK